MSPYPIFYAAVKAMGPKTLLHKRQATAIARKAGLETSVLVDGGADIAGTFSHVDSPDGTSVSSGAFPDAGSMDRTADVTGFSEARVLVNVAEAGSGTLGVTGDINTSVSLASTGVVVSDWEPVGGGEWSWVSTGSATVGLVQLQMR